MDDERQKYIITVVKVPDVFGAARVCKWASLLERTLREHMESHGVSLILSWDIGLKPTRKMARRTRGWLISDGGKPLMITVAASLDPAGLAFLLVAIWFQGPQVDLLNNG